jgi:uncharacterized membrane protein HdeD (DUF308 family)
MSINTVGSLMPSLRDHWVFFFVEGIILVVLGFLAILIPPIATLGVEIHGLQLLDHAACRT